MDGTIADLKSICDLADKYGAWSATTTRTLLVRQRGRKTRVSEVMGRIDIITGTLGKALGGASGGSPAPAGILWSCFGNDRVLTCFSTVSRPTLAAILKALEL